MFNNNLVSISNNNIINLPNYRGSYILEIPIINLNAIVVIYNFPPPPVNVNHYYNKMIINDIEKPFYNSIIHIMNSSNSDITINDYRNESISENCKNNIIINNNNTNTNTNTNTNNRHNYVTVSNSIIWKKNTKISFTFIKLNNNKNGWLYSG